MEEIKVKEYVRTKKGSIGKFKSYGIDDVDEKIVYFKNNKGTTCVDENEIVKHSPNIMDLIEVGDYINGSKLNSIDYAEDEFGNCDKLHFYYHFEDDEKDVNEYYDKLIIKSIVTKEQFKSMEYKLGE